MTQETIGQRAKKTLERRIVGSFGYRAADSVLNGFDPAENVNIYKAHGGERDGLEDSMNLAIDRAKPTVTADEIAKELNVDAGEAKEILSEQTLAYDDMVANRGQYLIQLHTAWDKAPKSYNHLSAFSVDNFKRVADNLVMQARRQFVRSKNAEWAKAVQEAVTPLLTEVNEKAKPVEETENAQ